MAYVTDPITETRKFIDLPYWMVYASTVLQGKDIRGGHWSMHTQVPPMIDGLVVTLAGYLASHPVKEVHIQYPADWWEAVKDRWFPAWARVWCPVRYTTHHYDARFVFPNMAFPTICGESIRVVDYTQGTTTIPTQGEDQ